MGLLNNQKARRPHAGLGTEKSRCFIYSTSLFTQKHNNPRRFGAVGGGRRKGNTLYQQRDLQSLQSLEKRRIQLCRENKPKGSRVQRAAGPKRVPLGFDRRVDWRRKLYHRAEGAQRAGLFSYKSWYFLIHRGHSLSASIQTWGETIWDSFYCHYSVVLFEIHIWGQKFPLFPHS